jgi:mycothiol synthase
VTMMLTGSDLPQVAGLRLRLYRGPEDLPGMLRAYQAANDADGIEQVLTLDELTLAYSTLVNCDPKQDLLIAEVDGETVAYSRVFWQDLVEGRRLYEAFGFVDPSWRRRGIGSAMLRWNEARLREIAAGHLGVAPKWLGSEGSDSNEGNKALMRNAGYEPVRYFYEMVQPALETVPDLPMPHGVAVPPVERSQFRQIWDAMNEAFRDHWGEAEWTDADWRRFEAEPDHADPSLWRIGWDGDQVAGVVVTSVQAEENKRFRRARVYVESVAVRRPWRRRGLARALIAGSLRAARVAGFTSASLGVDAESPTGALALYESLGFVPDHTFISYRKPL